MDEEDAVLEAQTAAAAEKSAEKNPAAAVVVDLTTDSEAADNTSRLKARTTCVRSRSLIFFPKCSFAIPKISLF